MTFWNVARGTVCAAALLIAAPAVADVTPAQVWDEWQTMLAISGEGSLTFDNATETGGVLTVTNARIAGDSDESSFDIGLGDIAFTDQGDGTVRVTMASSYPMTITGADGTVVTLALSQTELVIVASGAPGALTYDVAADTYRINIEEVMENGTPAFDGEFAVTLNDLTGTYTVIGTADRNIDYALASASVDLLADVTTPENNGNFVMSGQISALRAAAQVVLPEGFNMSDPSAFSQAGFDFDGNYGYDSATYVINSAADGEDTAIAMTTGTGDVGVAMSAAELTYDVAAEDISADITSSSAPFPVTISLARYGFGLAMPAQATEEPAAFGLRLELSDLAVNDEVWMMGDPTNALSHDPITLRLDIAGTAKLLFDLFNPDETAAMAEGEAPGELHSLTLNDLTLNAVGASVTGTGDFTFDNSDMTTFNGFPRPEGSATFDLIGVNKVIDGLISMGVLPQDQAMMGRMMMGMFAQTVGDDHLKSTIEVTGDGRVLANGQQIR